MERTQRSMMSVTHGEALLPGLLLTWGLAGACSPPRSQAYDPVTMDPPVTDTVNPPTLVSFRLDVEGSRLNGMAYLAEGAGPHPTVILLPGYPGLERNLDLAQAIRRNRVNVVTLNFRGTWGSGGEMSPLNEVEDTKAVIAFLRSGEGARTYRTDPGRIALLGHSMGSWVALTAAAADPALECVGAMAVTNLGPVARRAAQDESFRAAWSRSIRAPTGPGAPVHIGAGDPAALMAADPDAYDLLLLADALAPKSLLLLGGRRDEGAPPDVHQTPLAAALREHGAQHLTETLLDADHSFSGARIALAREVVGWLQGDCGY